jgi:hypothetical protein
MLDLPRLEGEVGDPHGGFAGWRICHTGNDALWAKHRDEFAAPGSAASIPTLMRSRLTLGWRK